MILVIDVGNTNIVMGVYRNEELCASLRMATDRQKTVDEYGILTLDILAYQGIKSETVRGAIISSVVPPVTNTFERMVEKYFKVQPKVVGPGMKTGLVMRYENPKEVGADRVVNAVAAYSLYGGPIIVVDFGTATTFCAIDENGDYLGGAIAPGIGIASEALFARAAKLPRVELIKPKTVIGKNTVSSMQSGIVFGFVGQVDEIVRRMKAEMGGVTNVVATGGLAELISFESSEITEVNPNLTLIGLRLLYERNG